MREVVDKALLDKLEGEMKAIVDSTRSPRMLYEMMRYHLGWRDEQLRPIEHYGGKRFRPLLCLLTYYGFSGVYDKAFPAAVSIELIHNFSLIHDDIEDRDEERRHRPTLWKLWGIAKALNAGDGMHVLANLAAVRLKELNVTDAKIVEVLKVLNETVMRLCEGQHMDISFEERMDVGVEEYLEMIYRKTAALIEAAVHVGALLATEDERKLEDARSFGRDLGMAFQIRDDIIGTWGDPKNTGKPRGSDIQNRKKTLPVIYTFQNCSETERRRLVELYKSGRLSASEVEEVISLMEDKKAYHYCAQIAGEYEESAVQALERLGLEGEAEKKIKAIVDFLVTREY